MPKVHLTANYDKAAVREWLIYEFWKPADFAANHGLSERTVRHYLTLGMPFHGTPHKGQGGVRLGKSADTWLMAYRANTCDGALRFPGMTGDFLDFLQLHVAEERMAYQRLYGGPQPHDPELDEYLTSPEGAQERRSWRTKFREITRRP